MKELLSLRLGYMVFDKIYEYKGFAKIHSIKFDHISLENIDGYINNVYNLLGKCVVYTNEERLDNDDAFHLSDSSIQMRSRT